MMITPLYLPWVGGLEIFVSELMAELRERGHEVIVVTGQGLEARDEVDEVEGVTVHRLGLQAAMESRDTSAIFRVQTAFGRIMSSFDPDVVHAHDVGALLWMYRRATRRHPRPLLATLHSVISRHFEGSVDIQAGLLRGADWVTGVSQATVDDAVGFEPSLATRISVVRNGVLPPVREVSAVPNDPPRLLCVGRLVPLKGFNRALDALARLAPHHPTVRLTIAGDGPESASLVQQARHLGIADRVDFLGLVDRERIGELLDESTVVVMPSRFEGMPLVALEAAWAGRPVVATRAPGLDEAVHDGATGLTVDDQEGVEGLADAIRRIVTDADLAQRLGDGARVLAEREYSLSSAADAYEALYRCLAAGE